MSWILKIVFTFFKSFFFFKEEEYGTETLCGLSSLKYLLSGFTLNHYLKAGTLHCSKLFRNFAFENKEDMMEEWWCSSLIWAYLITVHLVNNCVIWTFLFFHFLSQWQTHATEKMYAKEDFCRPLQSWLPWGRQHGDVFFASAHRKDEILVDL